KMKVGLTVDQDIANVRAVRNAIGAGPRLMIDANHAYNLREATALARAVEAYDIYWFEEPLSPEYYSQYAELRKRTTIPIAAGECEYLRYGFDTLLQANAVDILQPDICASGGLTEAKRIATLASLQGIDIVPHTWGSGIALATAIHFVANLDLHPGRLFEGAAMIENDRTEFALREELTNCLLELKEGKISIPKSPGLGIEVNEDAIAKYSVQEKEVELMISRTL
ncbi:MAG: mandelate racemase/muconate lactonizing enzyme family protein, partial [Saprospiraceae bacterium]|nr:mandelate racemase/muconate lactonizing enzyme family protein [Saprospiraceae bacterium]